MISKTKIIMKNFKYHKTIIIFFIILLSFMFQMSCKNDTEKNISQRVDDSTKVKKVYGKNNITTDRDIIEGIKGDTVKTELTRGGEIVSTHSRDPVRLDIPFNYNSAELSEDARFQLDELGKALMSEELANINLELGGHTDERGSTEYNLNLSLKRVESVNNYLKENFGINKSNITIKGYGESKPIHKNAKTEIEHADNRRVEIKRLSN